MATSGKFTQYFTPDHTLQLDLEWRAVQNIERNESTVYLELYFKSNHPQSSFNSGIVRPMFMTMDGHVSPTWQVTKSIGGMQRRHIGSWNRVVKHNENGTKSLNIGASFTWQVTWGGVWVDTVKVNGRIDLNDIKRKSISSTRPNFSMGQNLNVSINRQSGNFKHLVVLDVQDKSGNWVNVRMDHGQGSSCVMNFSVAEKTIMFKALGGRASMESRMHVHTGTGGSNDKNLGYYTYAGNVSTADSSTATSSTLVLDSAAGAKMSLNRKIPLYIETVHEIVVGNRKFYKENKTAATSFDWNLTAAEKLQIMNDNPNSSRIKGTMNVTSYYLISDKATKIRDTKSSDIYFEIKNSAPTLGGGLSVVEANAQAKAVVGNIPNTFIQGISSLNINVPVNIGQPKNGAKIARHIATVDGKSIAIANSGAAHTIAFGNVNSAGAVDIKLEVEDSRGFKGAATIRVNVAPYKKPILTGSFERQNGFSDSVDLNVGGKYSPLVVNGANKNQITRLQYRNRQANGAWTGYKNLAIKTSGDSFTTTKVVEKVAATNNYQAEVVIADKFGTSTITLNGSSAKPILFIDSFYENVGIGKYPDKGIDLDIAGSVSMAGFKAGTTEFNVQTRGNVLVFGGSKTFNGYYLIDSPSCNTDSTFFFQTKGGVPANVSVREIQLAKTSFNQKEASIATTDNGKRMLLRGEKVEIENSAGTGRGTMDLNIVEARQVNAHSGTGGLYLNLERNDLGDLQLTCDSRSPFILSKHTYNRTYGTAANMFVTENGVIGRSVSAKKYKYAIAPIKKESKEMLEFGERILDIKPSSWYDKSEVDDIVEEYEKGIKSGSVDRRELRKQYGLIAEDFVEAGLGEFVSYGSDGQVEGLQYDRAWIALIPVVKSLKERIEELENERVVVKKD